MRQMYNRIRVGIAEEIRDLEEIRAAGGEAMDALELDSSKLRVEEGTARLNQDIAELVATRDVTPAMGSSLINDGAFAHDIAINLIRAAQVLFSAAEEEAAGAAQTLMLDKSDIERIEAAAL